MLRVAEHVLKDLPYAARRLRRTPGFAVVASLLIAVSLACNTVIFGLVDALFLRTLPVREPQSLVQLFELRPGIPTQEYFSVDLRDRIAAESTTLTNVMGELDVTTSLEGADATSSVDVGLVTPNYFDGLGIKAVLGRNPGLEDDVAGNRIAVLSHRAWTSLFAEDPSAVGRTVRLAGHAYLIVGVLPKGFNGTSVDGGPDFRVLFANREDFGPGPMLDGQATKILGRLRGGESLDSAREETRVIWSRYRKDFVAGGGVIGPFDRDLSVELRSVARGTSRVREQFQGTLLLLLGGAGLLLAMVCLNVGGLLLARITQSRKDVAMRRALGASRGRIAGQWAAESLLVATIGGVAGLLLATAAMPALVRWLSPLIGFGSLGRPPTLDVSFDLRIAAFSVMAILGTGIAVALVPTFWWTRKDAYAALKSSADDRENRRIQSGLSVVQVAISTVLLLGGALMIRTLDGLDAVDPGFDRDMLVRFALDPRLSDYNGPAEAAFQRRLLEETATLPGVESSSITAMPLMQGLGMVMVVAPPGRRASGSSWNTSFNQVTASYFDTMGMTLLSGTVFEDRLVRAGEPTPVVVNEAFARRFFGSEDAVGRVFDSGREFRSPTYRIVGVVSDADYRSLRESDPPIFYINPLSRESQAAGAFSLLVRTTTPEGVIAPVREIVHSIDPTLPVLEAVTMSDEIDRSLWRERLAAALTGGFAVIGLTIAAIGLYAILAHFVASRRREIGVRIALGAIDLDVLRLVAQRVAPVLVLGVLAGTAVHVVLSHWLASLLYGVSILDPAAVAVSGVALLVMSLLAAMVPATHAISLDPARTLRED